MSEKSYFENEDFSIYSFTSIINYIKNNYIQFLMLILVFFIIFIVDHISNINAMIFSITSPVPSFPVQQTHNNSITKHSKIKFPKKSRSLKK